MEDYFDYNSAETPAEWDLDIEQFLERSQEQEQERLEQELEQIEEQLSQRNQIHEEAIDELESKLDWYVERLKQLYKRRSGKQGERDRLKRTLEGLYESIREEKRSSWLDQKELEKERREVLRELDELDNSILELL